MTGCFDLNDEWYDCDDCPERGVECDENEDCTEGENC